MIEARYPGQVHQLAVALPAGALTRADLDDAVERFHALYLATYGIDMRAPVQFVTLPRAGRGAGREARTAARRARRLRARAAMGERSVFFGERGVHETVPVYRWEDLRPGADHLAGRDHRGRGDVGRGPTPGWAVALDTMRNVVLTSALSGVGIVRDVASCMRGTRTRLACAQPSRWSFTRPIACMNA